MHKPLNHKSQSEEELSLRRNKERKLCCTSSQLSSPVHASLTQVTLQRKLFVLWHTHHNEREIRIWVQLSTSLVAQLHTSQVLRQSCNPTPAVDHQHLGTVKSQLTISSTVYVQKPERKIKTNQPHSAISASWWSLSAAAGSSSNLHVPPAPAKGLCSSPRETVPVGLRVSAHGYSSRNTPGEPRGSSIMILTTK